MAWWKTIPTVLVSAALLLSCATLEKQVKEPELSISNVQILGMSLTDAQLAFDVDVKNPNSVGLSMNGLSYSLAIEDKPLFNGAAADKLNIAAKTTSRVTLPFTLRYEDVLGTLSALRENEELRYTVSGKADFGLFSLPYSRTGTFSLPKLPDVTVQSLRINKLTLSGAELTLGLKVNNANGFPIRLNGIDYDLKLADASLLKGKSTQPISIDANGDGTMMLKLAVDYAQIGSLTQKLSDGGALPIEFNSQVKVPAGGAEKTLPYNWKGDVPIAH